MSDAPPPPMPPPNRKNVRRFFLYRLKKETPKRDPNFQLVLIFGFIGLLLGGLIGGGGAAIAVGLLAAGGAFAFDVSMADSEAQTSRDAVNVDHARFLELAEETRAVQSADLVRAMTRIFARSQIDRDKLRILEHLYVFPEEERLFDDETEERRLGDLMNKSIRMISPGSFIPMESQVFRRSGGGAIEFFFNPMRLVMLLLTDTQLVVCSVEVDSIDGNVKEEIQRFALSKIVNIHFSATRLRIKQTREEIIQLAEDIQMPADQVDEIKRSIGYGNDPLDGWRKEEIASTLLVSRIDASAIELPIRRQIVFGKDCALDADAALSEDEIKMDNMVNELNRLVESR